MIKKVFVSGCFDLLHSGHIAFFKQAAQYGDLYVSLGSDKTIIELKNKEPVYSEEERLLMIKELKCVKEAFIAQGGGMLDFEGELKNLKPDIFIVNKDGDAKEKRELCESLGIDYIVLEREPLAGLPRRASTAIRSNLAMPYRIDLAGGWLDQPFVSKYYPGPVLTISINPEQEFNLRSGLATSTRNKAIRMLGNQIPKDDEEIAKALFGYENLPGTKEVAGSQDALGIVLPGLNYLYYDKEHWPKQIKKVREDDILDWLESIIYLISLKPREGDFNVLGETYINEEGVKKLSEAAENCFKAILLKDINAFGKHMTKSFEAQIQMFPRMVNDSIKKTLENYKEAKGWKISGAGGGGYLILVSDKPIQDALKIKIRRAK